MINGYSSLNNSISKTIVLIDEVTTASKEQKSGIEQINDAITLLDRQIQKNAAAATQTKEIAISTQTVASRIVKDVNEKEFDGKDEVKSRRSGIPRDVQNIKKGKTYT